MTTVGSTTRRWNLDSSAPERPSQQDEDDRAEVGRRSRGRQDCRRDGDHHLIVSPHRFLRNHRAALPVGQPSMTPAVS